MREAWFDQAPAPRPPRVAPWVFVAAALVAIILVVVFVSFVPSADAAGGCGGG